MSLATPTNLYVTNLYVLTEGTNTHLMNDGTIIEATGLAAITHLSSPGFWLWAVVATICLTVVICYFLDFIMHMTDTEATMQEEDEE